MDTQEIIEQRKRDSEKQLTARRTKQEQELKDRKEGVAYIHNNKIPILIKRFNKGLVLVLVYERKENDIVNFAYSLCSSKDQFSLKIAKGLAGKRLKDKIGNFYFSSCIAQTKEEVVLSIGFQMIALWSLTEPNWAPDCLYREFMESASEAWYYEIIKARD